MPKVTSKLQLTVPKKIADEYGIRPGDELEWISTGNGIRVELAAPEFGHAVQLTKEQRQSLFDANMAHADNLLAAELKEEARKKAIHTARGWTREELYEDRGFPRRH